ncbi:hypothetical protein BC937DRAFT_92627 [Endogone sp. FLAS-F59071]|nr:hypothetical protein BC937DRAFT_92627 [Endogone sp. FLAS-F59071]|eukprot:RUS15307.1 hypothetical protein BC937DRAFT_92627 [Endogone sp. FLAS-F59071]
MGQLLSKVKKFFDKRKEELQSKQSQSNQFSFTLDDAGNPVAQDAKLLDGRQFKKSGSPTYPLPNDQSEFERLNMQHFIFHNYRSPVTKDLERGIKELAKQFANSTFTGTDITNVFCGTESTAPPNVNFLEADTIKGLPFEDNTFDFVFQRAQVLCYKVTDWPIALKEMIRVCKPGGYVESFEAVLPEKDNGPALAQHTEWFRTVLELRDTLAGLSSTLSLRFGALAGVKTNYGTVINATRPQIATALGIGDEEYAKIADAAMEEITNPTEFHPHLTYYVRFGRKALQN